MALGSYNDAIFILGGYGAPGKQVVEFSATNKDFTDYGINVLQYNAYGGGDFYTQIDNTVYMLSGSGSNLNTFEMTNRAYTPSWKAVSTPVSYTGCLTSASVSNTDYIYVLGGYDEGSSIVLNTVQVLTVSTMQWVSNISPMKTPRNRLSCIVDPSTLQLYAIAGKNGVATDPASFLKTIEKINVNGIAANQWGIISSTLTYPAIGTRSIIYEQRILVIGGRYGDNGYKYLTTIHVIDPQTDAITLPYPSLPREVAEAAAVIMGGNLYVFGGSICHGGTDCNVAYLNYLVFQFPTSSPTNKPTSQPTKIPSALPSNAPTVPPSFNPSSDPTVTPTSDPSTGPTMNPSVHPTITPTVETGSPTKRPIIIAAGGPTPRPTGDSGRVDENENTTDEFSEGKPDTGQTTGSQRPHEYYMLVIVILLVAICCASVIYVYYRRKRRSRERTEEEDVLELEECHAIATTTPGDEKGETMDGETPGADGLTPGGDDVTGEDDIMGEDDSDSSNDGLYIVQDKETVRDTPQVVKEDSDDGDEHHELYAKPTQSKTAGVCVEDSDEDTEDSDDGDEHHELYAKPTQSKTAGVCVEDSDEDTEDGDQRLYSKPNKSKTEK
eukprot:65732_1